MKKSVLTQTIITLIVAIYSLRQSPGSVRDSHAGVRDSHAGGFGNPPGA